MDKVYLITWKASDWHGKTVVTAMTSLEAWEKFIAKWRKDLDKGIADLQPEEIDRYTVEIAADEFIA